MLLACKILTYRPHGHAHAVLRYTVVCQRILLWPKVLLPELVKSIYIVGHVPALLLEDLLQVVYVHCCVLGVVDLGSSLGYFDVV